jgi:hypothetical protein
MSGAAFVLAATGLWLGLSVLCYFAYVHGPATYCGDHRADFKQAIIHHGSKDAHLSAQERVRIAERWAFYIDCLHSLLLGLGLTTLILALNVVRSAM